MKNFALKTLVAVSFAAIGFSAHADSVTMNATATVVTPLSSSAVTHVSFGRFASHATVAREVVMSVDGVRTGTAALMASDTGSAGLINVTGEPNASFVFIANNYIKNLEDGSGNTMQAVLSHQIVGTAPMTGIGNLDADGKAAIKIGGTLTVTAGAPAATYSTSHIYNLAYN